MTSIQFIIFFKKFRRFDFPLFDNVLTFSNGIKVISRDNIKDSFSKKKFLISEFFIAAKFQRYDWSLLMRHARFTI